MSDWQPDPRKSPLEELLADAEAQGLAVTWSHPGDLSRMSVETMTRRNETPDWTVTPHDPPEFLLDGLSAEEKFPPHITLGEN